MHHERKKLGYQQISYLIIVLTYWIVVTDTLSYFKIAYFIGAGEFMTHSQSRSTRDICVSQPGVSVRLGNGHVERL